MGTLVPDIVPMKLGVLPEVIVPNGRMRWGAIRGHAMIRCLGYAVLPSARRPPNHFRPATKDIIP